MEGSHEIAIHDPGAIRATYEELCVSHSEETLGARNNILGHYREILEGSKHRLKEVTFNVLKVIEEGDSVEWEESDHVRTFKHAFI